jgi:hypothetical protein
MWTVPETLQPNCLSKSTYKKSDGIALIKNSNTLHKFLSRNLPLCSIKTDFALCKFFNRPYMNMEVFARPHTSMPANQPTFGQFSTVRPQRKDLCGKSSRKTLTELFFIYILCYFTVVLSTGPIHAPGVYPKNFFSN